MTCVPWLSMGHRDKEMLSCNDMQQGSCVFKTCSRVTEAPVMCYHDQHTMWTCAATPRYSAPPHS
jgi:hypothetical protein